MDSRYDVRLAGVGCQGLVLAGMILAEAAAIYDGKNAVQTQSYGAETRGGPSMSDVIISQEEIDYPKVLAPNLLLAMAQEAYNKYGPGVQKDAIIVVDSAHVTQVSEGRVYSVPITAIAREFTGKTFTASIAALGLLVGLTGLVSAQAIRSAVASRAPKGTEELNLKALAAGLAAAEKLKQGESL
ncbi:MAG: 2-oxoacid:acceptor oxidoreductase family protein [Chloroflexi bacterium]|nr:2-oxoacid:acceptor oxidoreductase family protein [Chloroflexota bacterium]